MIDRIDALREEHRREAIGSLIYELLEDILWPIVKRAPLNVLADRAVENAREIFDDLTQSFVEHLVEGRLSEAFVYATSESHLRALLTRYASQFIAGLCRKGELERLSRRALNILDGRPDLFTATGVQRLRRWSIRGGSSEPYGLGDAALKGLARGLPLPSSTRRFRRNTQIASRVLDDDDLRQLLVDALTKARCALTISELKVVMSERLDLYAVQTLSISHLSRTTLEVVAEQGASMVDQADAHIIAGSLFGELSAQQLEILRRRWGQGEQREQTARALGVSHGTVDNEQDRAGRVILAACGGDRDLAIAVLDLLAGRPAPGRPE
jgi:hypothetical protein